MQGKKTRGAIVALSAAAALLLGVPAYQESRIQTVYMEAVTEHAVGDEDAVAGNIQIRWDGTVKKGSRYRASVHYDIVERKGRGLFCKEPGCGKGVRAGIGCSEMETAATFEAREGSIRLDISLRIDPSDITGAGGAPFDPAHQMLCPAVEIEEN